MNGTTTSFIWWYQTFNCKPNFTKLLESGKPRRKFWKSCTQDGPNFLCQHVKFSGLIHICCHPCCSKPGWSFSPELWVSKPCCCGPFLTWISLFSACICLLLATTFGDLTPSSDTQNPSQRHSSCTVQTQATHLGPGWMQGLTPGLVRCTGLGLLLTLHCKQPHTCSPVPPLASDADCPDVGSPFWFCFVQGNISHCNGCTRGQDKKPLPPPDNLMVCHKENVFFLNINCAKTVSGAEQVMQK